jgi:hypothetical protein
VAADHALNFLVESRIEMKKINHVAMIALLTAAATANAAPIDYRFDSVSAFDAGRNWTDVYDADKGMLTVTGVLQNSTTPTTVSVADGGTSATTLAGTCSRSPSTRATWRHRSSVAVSSSRAESSL